MLMVLLWKITMDNKFSNYTKQELRCLIARHGDTKKELEIEIKEIEDNIFLMRRALWDKQEVKGE